MIELIKADDYFTNHLESDIWQTTIDSQEKALYTAEMILKSHFNLRDGAETNEKYLYAVCEQALHLLMISPERYKLKKEGVKEYSVDDMKFVMDTDIISPIARKFIKSLTKLRVGEIE
jgi:hypothetical protein